MSLFRVVNRATSVIPQATLEPHGRCSLALQTKDSNTFFSGLIRLGNRTTCANACPTCPGNLWGMISRATTASAMKAPSGKLAEHSPVSAVSFAPLSDNLFPLPSELILTPKTFCNIISNTLCLKFSAESFLLQSLLTFPKKCSSQWVPRAPN